MAAHGDLQRSKELLELQPGLLNAAWDWGGGDFETALGGASHMELCVSTSAKDLGHADPSNGGISSRRRSPSSGNAVRRQKLRAEIHAKAWAFRHLPRRERRFPPADEDVVIFLHSGVAFLHDEEVG